MAVGDFAGSGCCLRGKPANPVGEFAGPAGKEGPEWTDLARRPASVRARGRGSPPDASSTSSDSRGQARAAQGPKSGSVRQAQAMPASGSTHKKLPERPGDFTPV
jgi:hypothetical protein